MKSLAYYMNKLARDKKKYGTVRKDEQCLRCHKYKRVKGTKYCKECAEIVIRVQRSKCKDRW